MVNKDKIAIVTGSSAGLGASVAIQLAKRGINVVINYSKNEVEAKKFKKFVRTIMLKHYALKPMFLLMKIVNILSMKQSRSLKK